MYDEGLLNLPQVNFSIIIKCLSFPCGNILNTVVSVSLCVTVSSLSLSVSLSLSCVCVYVYEREKGICMCMMCVCLYSLIQLDDLGICLCPVHHHFTLSTGVIEASH